MAVSPRNSEGSAKRTTKEIRQWAIGEGREVSPRGRIPAEIERAFHDAQAETAPARKVAAKKSVAKKSVAKKAVAKKADARKTDARETDARKAVAKKAPAARKT